LLADRRPGGNPAGGGAPDDLSALAGFGIHSDGNVTVNERLTPESGIT
jgi:hypothetical protein